MTIAEAIGKLLCDFLCDFLEFGVRGRRIYLRNIAGDFEFGTNFASSGGSALNVTGWKPESGFRMPFSLNVQMQWFQRSVVRIQTYYSNKSTFGDAAVVTDVLPTEASLKQSLNCTWCTLASMTTS